MRKLITYALSAACLVWAASASAEAGSGGQPIPKIYNADDAPPPSGSTAPGATPPAPVASLSVRGHGKIDSPSGALAAKPQVTGKASIQFNCSLPAGASLPSGSTHFQFQSGNLDFRASSHDGLVVSGASARITGAGTVNGAAGFRFVLSATAGKTDRFRMRITNAASGAVVYDSQMGDSDTAPATTVLTNGSIDITAPLVARAQKASIAPAAAQPRMSAIASPALAAPAVSGPPAGFDLTQNFPNPFRASTQVRFTLPERSHLKLMVLDVSGRQIATLAVGAWDPGSHTVSWSGRTDGDDAAPRGVYFVRMAAGLMSGEQRFVSLRKMVLD